MGPVVTAATAAALPVDAVLLHVVAEDGEAGLAAFARGHLPGARLAVRDAVTSRPMGEGDGRHPLPDPADFAAALGALGVSADTPVVAYDAEHGASAARLVYLLRVLGQPAAVLDGGIDGWEEDLETGPPPLVDPVEVPARPWPTDMLVDADTVAAHIAAGGTVLDARSRERFEGITEPLDPVAGHVPARPPPRSPTTWTARACSGHPRSCTPPTPPSARTPTPSSTAAPASPPPTTCSRSSTPAWGSPASTWAPGRSGAATPTAPSPPAPPDPPRPHRRTPQNHE